MVLFVQAPIVDTFSLAWHPKVGESHLYRVSVRMEYPVGTLEFQCDLQNRVTAVEKDGTYTMETLSLNPVMISGDERKDLPRTNATVQRYDRRGLPIIVKPEDRDADPFTDLLNHLTEFQAPSKAVQVGAEWVNDTTKVKRGEFGTPWLTYRLLDVTPSGSQSFAKVRISAKKGTNPEAASGTLYLSRPSNALFRLDEQIPHFQPDGENDEARVEIVIQEKLD